MSHATSHIKSDDAVKAADAKVEAPPKADGAAEAVGATMGGAPAPEAPSKPESKSAPPAPAAAEAKGATLFGVLDAEERIRRSAEQSERTLWTGAVVFTLLYATLIASQAVSVALVPLSERQKMRRGQDAPASISVELVPDPDKTSKTTKWREGASQQAPTPTERPPQPQQMASKPQPEVALKDTQDAKDEPRPEGSPMLLDIESLVDAAAADLKREIDHHYAKKPRKAQRQQQAALPSGGVKVRGTGASGKSSAFFRSVIASLMKTRPGPFALWGRVLVSFEISETGKLKYVHLLQSSGNSGLDRAAVNAIRRARFERPPPGLTADDRTYIIDYIFG